MSNTRLSQTILIILSLALLPGCDILTYSAKTKSGWKNQIVHQTIKWEVNTSEEDVRREFSAFLHETLQKSRYRDYLLLYQSNYSLEEQQRTYIYKIFRDREEKDAFLDASEDIISRTRALASNRFNERWSTLQPNTPVEKVYELLPELAQFNAPQLLYLDHTELHLADYWLSFDLSGYLLDFGKGNQQATPQRNENWVF